jgi:hypothetical protein
MIISQYTPEEKLQRIKLMMEYSLSKTYSENKQVIEEQSNDEYFKTAAKSIMNEPSQVANINFGNSTVNADQACRAIKKSVDGIGTTTSGIDYVVENGFKTIADTMAIIKKYPSIGGESLYDALEGEWFIGDTKTKLVDKLTKQLQEWCQTKPTISICQPKTPEQLKWGKL